MEYGLNKEPIGAIAGAKLSDRNITKITPDEMSCSASAKVSNEKAVEVNPGEISCPGNIKVTIQDKPGSGNEEQRYRILKDVFQVLVNYANEKRRFREIELRIRKSVIARTLRRCFEAWKQQTKCAVKKRVLEREKKRISIADEQKIETFIAAMRKKQKELSKKRESSSKENTTSTRNVATKGSLDRGKKAICKRVIVESPAQNRLKAQKKIIEQQKSKLLEQNKIIEGLKLKQLQNDLRNSEKNTVYLAKEAMAVCGKQTRRSLLRFMGQDGEQFLEQQPRVASPPPFLVRMEARAEARRCRRKLAEEERVRRLEELKKKEETTRREEEEYRRRLQQETLREVRRLREEQEQHRLREIEKFKVLSERADAFYRKYLLRTYVMKSLVTLIEVRNSCMKEAEDHYKMSLMKKVFSKWKTEAENQCKVRNELATSIYERNLLYYSLGHLIEHWRQEKRKNQVSRDFCDLKLQDRFFRTWHRHVLELAMERLEQENMVEKYHERKLKKKYIEIWKKYLQLAEEINESEKRIDRWRQIVQEIIPDFVPNRRGVTLEDQCMKKHFEIEKI